MPHHSFNPTTHEPNDVGFDSSANYELPKKRGEPKDQEEPIQGDEENKQIEADKKHIEALQTHLEHLWDRLKHENELIHQRLSWFLTIQGALFATFGLMVEKLITLETSPKLDKLKFLASVVCLVGFCSAMSALYAAWRAHRVLGHVRPAVDRVAARINRCLDIKTPEPGNDNKGPEEDNENEWWLRRLMTWLRSAVGLRTKKRKNKEWWLLYPWSLLSG